MSLRYDKRLQNRLVKLVEIEGSPAKALKALKEQIRGRREAHRMPYERAFLEHQPCPKTVLKWSREQQGSVFIENTERLHLHQRDMVSVAEAILSDNLGLVSEQAITDSTGSYSITLYHLPEKGHLTKATLSSLLATNVAAVYGMPLGVHIPNFLAHLMEGYPRYAKYRGLGRFQELVFDDPYSFLTTLRLIVTTRGMAGICTVPMCVNRK